MEGFDETSLGLVCRPWAHAENIGIWPPLPFETSLKPRTRVFFNFRVNRDDPCQRSVPFSFHL